MPKNNEIRFPPKNWLSIGFGATKPSLAQTTD